MKERNDGLKAIYASSYARVHFSMTFNFLLTLMLWRLRRIEIFCYESKRKWGNFLQSHTGLKGSLNSKRKYLETFLRKYSKLLFFTLNCWRAFLAEIKWNCLYVFIRFIKYIYSFIACRPCSSLRCFVTFCRLFNLEFLSLLVSSGYPFFGCNNDRIN
jgi:hypothetical protein